jgi:DUF4097 and DUF4098 domain-containing protein YvlB
MKIFSVACVALFAAGPLLAATPINQSRPLAPDGKVSIDNLKGRIVVRTWAQPQVKITGSLGQGVEKFIVDGDAHSLVIKVKYPQSNGNGWFGWSKSDAKSEPTTLEVMLPVHASVSVDAVSANVDIQGLAGGKLVVDSVSGNVTVAASSPGEASFDNVSGDLNLRLTSSKVKIDNVSGDLNLTGGFSGDLNIDSVSGPVKVTGSQINQFELSSVSGDATLQLGLQPSATLSTDAVSGSLTLILPKAASAKLHAETFSGDISAPVGHVNKEEYGPGQTLDARIGNGQGQIKLETFSGNIKVELQ